MTLQDKLDMENHLNRLNIASYIMVFIFLDGCFVSPVLVSQNIIAKDVAYYYIGVCVLLFVLIANITIIVVYCKYSGLPFKTKKHQKSLRHIGWIVIYWTCISIIASVLTRFTPLKPSEFKLHFKKEN